MCTTISVFHPPLYDKKSVPFIVAGAGGYNRRLHVLGKVFHEAQQKKRLPIQIHGEPEYLENFNDSQHGYLRIAVTKSKITLDYVTVPDPSESARNVFLKPYDTVEVTLQSRNSPTPAIRSKRTSRERTHK